MENAFLTPCRPIIVLGVHRSGTSLVSDLIVQWGAYPGDLSLHPPVNAHNPRGFFEYRPMIDLLVELAGTSVDRILSREFKDHLRDLSCVSFYREKAQRLIEGMEVKGTPWIWKEPNLSPFLPFWERIWKNPVYIVMVRNPYDSGKSFEKMFLSKELWETVRLSGQFCLLWQSVLLAILEHTENHPAVLFVSYEDLLQDPGEQCARLCDFLDRHVGLSAGREERLHRMAGIIDPGLWRNRGMSSFFDLPEASEEQKELFRYLMRKIEGRAEPFDWTRFPMPPGAEEYLENFDAFKTLMDEQAPRKRQ